MLIKTLHFVASDLDQQCSLSWDYRHDWANFSLECKIEDLIFIEVEWKRDFEPRHDKTNKVTVRPAKTWIMKETTVAIMFDLSSLIFHHSDQAITSAQFNHCLCCSLLR